MLSKLGKFIEKKPFVIIIVIILITTIFASFLPSLKYGTSEKDFSPENKIVKANDRVAEYFGGNNKIDMVYIEGNVVSPEAIKKEYELTKKLNEVYGVEDCIAVSNFVNNVCEMEYGKSIENCSYDEIENAYNDLMTDLKETRAIDKEERGDFADIKNFCIRINKTLQFSIEVYDLSKIERLPYAAIEWYISFRNKIIPNENLNISYRLAARIEAKPLWEVGAGWSSNVKNFGFMGYKKSIYLWMKPHGESKYFPIPLNGNVSIDYNSNKIDVEVSVEELSKYGIAPKFGNAELPGKIGNIKAGVRVYKLPYLRLPITIGFIKNIIEFIEKRAILNEIATWLLSKANLSLEEINKMIVMLNSSYAYSLKDLDKGWIILDEAPDNDYIDGLMIKPSFLEGMKRSSLAFLSKDYKNGKAKATLIIIQINGSIGEKKFKEVSKEIDKIVKEYSDEDLKMEATGSGIILHQIDEMTSESNKIIVPSIFIAIILILFFNFRRPSYVILPLLGLTIAIIWLFGTMSLLGIKFNTIAIALTPLLMGLGVDYSVHMFHNYRAEIQNGKKPGEAIIASIHDVGTAMFLATITTVISFLSFLTSSLPSIVHFGMLCAIGIVYTFIITITLLAALRYILDKNKEIKFKISKKYSLKKIMGGLSEILCHHPKKVLVTITIITIIMAAGAAQLKTTFSMKDFLPKNNEAIKTMERVTDEFPFSSQEQEYILIEGNVATLKALEGIKKTYENMKDDEYIARNPDGSLKVVCIYTIIQNAIKENKSIAKKFNIGSNGLPKNDKDVKKLFDYFYNSKNFGRDIKSILHKGNGYDATLIRAYTTLGVFESNKEKMGKLYNDLKEDVVNYGNAKSIVTGGAILTYVITSSLTKSQITSTILCLILAAIVLIISYRKPFLGLITMVPVVISAIWILGTMYFAGYSLNVMTIMITSLTIGLGITYAIHAVERFRMVADRTGDVIKAVDETVSHTGGAIMAAAITTIAGFAVLIFSPMPPEQQFGVITAMTILYALITTIFVLPPLVMEWGKWRKRKKGYIISQNKYD